MTKTHLRVRKGVHKDLYPGGWSSTITTPPRHQEMQSIRIVVPQKN